MLLEKFKQIKTFVFDVDGVLTDGSLLIPDDGQMIRRMNIKDGYALQLALKQGYRVAVISGGNSEAVRERLNRLGVKDVYLKVQDKKAALLAYAAERGLALEELLFMGDDIPDYTVMKLVGLACAPADAAAEIKQVSHYISFQPGGAGCARDVIEKVLKLNNNWPLDTDVPSK
ncbi:MAG: HAD hydrolase family protein [Williamsia sp.]|nr:HAD hydrolase family protein [Williamsia sp.]